MNLTEIQKVKIEKIPEYEMPKFVLAQISDPSTRESVTVIRTFGEKIFEWFSSEKLPSNAEFDVTGLAVGEISLETKEKIIQVWIWMASGIIGMKDGRKQVSDLLKESYPEYKVLIR